MSTPSRRCSDPSAGVTGWTPETSESPVRNVRSGGLNAWTLLCHALAMRFGRRKAAGVSGQRHIVGLADAIEALRAELTDAMGRGEGQRVQFRTEPIELTVQAVVTKDANGKIGWGTLGVGGKYESASTQTLTLKLRPMWRAPDGTLEEDPVIADRTRAPQRFGSAPLPGATPSGDD